MKPKLKKRYVLGIGYPWGIDLVNDGLNPTGVVLNSLRDVNEHRVTLKHLGKWKADKKYKLILERVR